MKNVLSHIGVSAAALFLFGVLPIQAQEAARAEIPFSFHSKMAAYPSGTYDVKVLSNTGSTLVLSNLDSRKSTFVPTASGIEPTAKTTERGPVLIFACDSGVCYLSEIWTGEKGYKLTHPQVTEESSTTRIVALVRAAR
jgi:hypothetical protein